MTVHFRAIKTLLAWSPDATDVPLVNGIRVQILPTVYHLPHTRKHQFAALLASDALLLVWDDDPSTLVERAEALESELIELVDRSSSLQKSADMTEEKQELNVTDYDNIKESGEINPEGRPTQLMNTVLVAFSLIIIMMLLGLGFRSVAVEVAVDKGYVRLVFLALTPVQVFFTLVCQLVLACVGRCTDSTQFFSQVIVGCIAQCIGPVRQMRNNSNYFSAKRSPRMQNTTLPHITIQCPVYKERLASVIVPMVKSVKQAISMYELQGGSVNIFINDDGLQLIDEEERRA